MKRLFYIIALTLTVLVGCQKEDSSKSLTEHLCGEWKHTSSIGANVYLIFNAGGTFEEYQKLDNGQFELRRGTWTLTDNIISGKYNDNEQWSSTYKVIVVDNSMTLTSQGEDGLEYHYSLCEVPDVVKENAIVIVKSNY